MNAVNSDELKRNFQKGQRPTDWRLPLVCTSFPTCAVWKHTHPSPGQSETDIRKKVMTYQDDGRHRSQKAPDEPVVGTEPAAAERKTERTWGGSWMVPRHVSSATWVPE